MNERDETSPFALSTSTANFTPPGQPTALY